MTRAMATSHGRTGVAQKRQWMDGRGHRLWILLDTAWIHDVGWANGLIRGTTEQTGTQHEKLLRVRKGADCHLANMRRQCSYSLVHWMSSASIWRKTGKDRGSGYPVVTSAAASSPDPSGDQDVHLTGSLQQWSTSSLALAMMPKRPSQRQPRQRGATLVTPRVFVSSCLRGSPIADSRHTNRLQGPANAPRRDAMRCRRFERRDGRKDR